ncbi:hypothetical protein IGS68_31595 (plasmid) [Skermanella sp. TT6]|uniref:Uncharacterized protein n=1 Tax=Skermanella cutis TaxID=2775420 RepID=A0ABX7BJ02_9PROT|nr:hypothetical protein [Skermanella sp. TT6]QQP93571.1 hypothetical protein IGS68_31595 [Skermanella sp. TT6]
MTNTYFAFFTPADDPVAGSSDRLPIRFVYNGSEAEADQILIELQVDDPDMKMLGTDKPISPSTHDILVQSFIVVKEVDGGLKYWAFFETADTSGKILYILHITPEEALIHKTVNPALSYIEVDEGVDSGSYLVDNSDGDPPPGTGGGESGNGYGSKSYFNTPWDPLSVAFSTLSPAAGSPATLTGSAAINFPVGTTVTLVKDMTTAAGITEQVYTHVSGTFSFTSNLKAPHRLRFEHPDYVTEEVTINVI